MSDDEYKTPASELAARIVDRLVNEELIRTTTKQSQQEFEKKLASGSLSIQDWLLAVELTLDKE